MKTVQNPIEAIQCIQSGQRIFVHGGAATPTQLLSAVISRADELRNIEFIHLHTEGQAAHADPKHQESFRVANLFVGSNMRRFIDSDRIDYIPCLLSEMPKLFRSNKRPIDVALLHLSPPDRHGYCTLGVSVDVARAAFETAQVIIAQINPHMPRVHGDAFIHVDDIDFAVETNDPIPETEATPAEHDVKAIGKHAASLIEDGACLQVGIGSIPNAVLQELHHHRYLGIHSEMWSDGALNLIKSGAVDNSRKSVHPGKTVSSFVMGRKSLYEFIDDNPAVIQLGADYVNNPAIIARNSNVVAINSALEIDLTGQICADSIGHRIISGVGGQMDFIRGATLSPGGKAMIALTSRSKRNVPRIVSTLKPGAGVVTSRAQVQYVITEYGIADLFGLTLNERAQALIRIAHPDDREHLSREWRETR